MKTLTVVGARPQFIKTARISNALRRVGTEVLVHTGQHYDHLMSDVFFDDLGIPTPEYNLGIGSGPHGQQTGLMLTALEEVMQSERPDVVLVFGDTNSTLAAALAASKLHIPIAHVEAGLRSGNRRMPEEINRILTDHVSDLLFCPTATAVTSLAREGIVDGVCLAGDIMHETLFEAANANASAAASLTSGLARYALATLHRAENTDDPARLESILRGFREVSLTLPIVWPVHPRVAAILDHRPDLRALLGDRVMLTDPLPYQTTASALKQAAVLITDSGGMQKEACWLGVPCVTTRDETEWVETVEEGANVLVGADSDRLVSAVLSAGPRTPVPLPDPLPSTTMVDALVDRFGG